MPYLSRPCIKSSTREERLAYVRERFVCKADCDACGICAMFRGKDVETALEDYIEGRAEYGDVLKRYRY